MIQNYQELIGIMTKNLIDRCSSPMKISKVLRSQAAEVSYEESGSSLETILEKFKKENVIFHLNTFITTNAFFRSIPEDSVQSFLQDVIR